MEDYDDSIDIFSLLNPILKWRRAVAAVVFLFVLLAAVVSPFLKVFYEARVKLFLGKTYDPVLNVGADIASGGQGQGGSKDLFSQDIGLTAVKFYTEILKSKPFLTHFAGIKLKLGKGKEVSSYDYFKIKKGAPGAGDAINSILSNIIELEPDRKSGIMLLKVRSAESDYSIACANAVTRELENYIIKFITGRNRKESALLQQRLSDAEARLNSAEDKLKRFRERNKGIINAPELQMKESKIEREVKINENIYTGFLEQLEKTKLFEKMEVGPLVVIEYASSAARKRAISPKKLVIIALFAGLFIGIFFSYVAEFAGKALEQADSKELSEFKNGLRAARDDIRSVGSIFLKSRGLFAKKFKRHNTKDTDGQN